MPTSCFSWIFISFYTHIHTHARTHARTHTHTLFSSSSSSPCRKNNNTLSVFRLGVIFFNMGAMLARYTGVWNYDSCQQNDRCTSGVGPLLDLPDRVSHRAADRSIVQELCESRGGRPGLSVLTSLLVSVDVKLY